MHGLFFTWTQNLVIHRSYITVFTHQMRFVPTQPIVPCYPLFTYFENQLSCSLCECPSTLVPGLLSTAQPLLLLPPYHTPQIKLQYLHRWHQQHQPSSSDTICNFVWVLTKWSIGISICIHLRIRKHLSKGIHIFICIWMYIYYMNVHIFICM